MATLNILTIEDREHWKLHLNAALKDNPSMSKTIKDMLGSKTALPNIKHPAYIHDWLEQPERRTEIEAWNG